MHAASVLTNHDVYHIAAHHIGLVKAAIAVCLLVIAGLYVLRHKFRQRRASAQRLPTVDELLWNTRPSGPPIPKRYDTAPHTPRRPGDHAQLSRLEGHLRIAVLSADARERLVTQAMKATRGDRAAAIQKVLEDLERDNRWAIM